MEEIQDLYVNTLLEYIGYRRPNPAVYVGNLLSKLTDLRTLSAEHANVLFNLKLEKGSLPPLLTEYFDVSE